MALQEGQDFGRVRARLARRNGAITGWRPRLCARNHADELRCLLEVHEDDLHQTLLPWDEVLEDWESTTTEKSQAFEAVLKKTYQFLARNYSQAKHWRLAARRAP